MALQNRVSPFGEIVAVPDRGALMGNRGGCLCAEPRVLSRRRWVSRRWILCVLEYRGWSREVMQPGQYTELFFLDEPTGLAAGHRPCAFCRPEAFRRFKAAWLAGNPGSGLADGASIDAIDRVLHSERLEGRTQRRFASTVAQVPVGAMVAFPDSAGGAWLRATEGLRAWGFGGYGPVRAFEGDRAVEVLTPRSTVQALRAGYAPCPSP